MQRHWRSRAVEVGLPMAAARRMWGQAWRVDALARSPRGTRRATVLLCREDPSVPACTPIGWCSVRWRVPEGAEAVIDRVAWDAESGFAEDEVWRAVAALAGVRPGTGAATGHARGPAEAA